MPTIQSSVGLVSGLPITEIVDQLMSIAQKPRDRVEERLAGVQQQQVAIGELTALTIATQLATNKLASESVYQQRTATSSAPELVTATVTGDPAPGTYQFTPVRLAQNHQMVSAGFASLDEPIGTGALDISSGGFVDRSVELAQLNGGAGVERGKIRITDRSGSGELIDLRFVQTIGDVLDRINSAETIRVLAVANGDSIQLIDQTGDTTTELSVREVGGNTATDLGLGGVDVAADVATGLDLMRLHERFAIGHLNDGTGLSIRDELPDLDIQLRDGSSLQIDLQNDTLRTVGELLDALNTADPARLQAAISSDGKRFVLTDLTAGSGTFSVDNPAGGTLATDLGLTNPAVGDSITGQRIIGDLSSPLLSSLGGGSGLGMLGEVSITDRAGGSAIVDLASAETLSDVINLLNDSGVGIRASINDARNGIVLQDLTGSTDNHLVVANSGGTTTADLLGLAIDADQQLVDGGPLHLQVVHEQTRLDSLKHGAGVQLGSFIITDSTGETSGVNLLTSEAETVGDVLELINGLDLAVEARINDAGNGIVLVDTADGGGTLMVEEAGAGSTAGDLKLLGSASVVDVSGTPTQVIDGAMVGRLQIAAEDTLQDVVDKINALDAGVSASILQTGSGLNPFHIVLTSQVSGTAGEMMIDASQLGIEFQEIASARDAILQIGSADLPGAGILATSSTNDFSHVVEGVKLTLNGVSANPVAITVATSDDSLVNSVQLLVDQFNKLHEAIKTLTYFDPQSGTKGPLMGSNETLQIESRLSQLMTSRFFGAGTIQSLEQVGVSFQEDGTLKLDEFKLEDQFAADPEGVQQFFTEADFGFAAKFNNVIESLAGEGDSLLISRNATLQRKLEAYNDRLEFYDQRLERERNRLLKYYYNLEIAISKIQSSQSALASLAPLPASTSSASSTQI